MVVICTVNVATGNDNFFWGPLIFRDLVSGLTIYHRTGFKCVVK